MISGADVPKMDEIGHKSRPAGPTWRPLASLLHVEVKLNRHNCLQPTPHASPAQNRPWKATNRTPHPSLVTHTIGAHSLSLIQSRLVIQELESSRACSGFRSPQKSGIRIYQNKLSSLLSKLALLFASFYHLESECSAQARKLYPLVQTKLSL